MMRDILSFIQARPMGQRSIIVLQAAELRR